MLPRDLNLSLQYLGGCIQAMLSDPRQLIQSDYSRVYLAKARLEQAKAMSLVQAQDDPFHNIQNTVRHNLENLDPSIAARRPLALLGPLLGIDSVGFNVGDLKVLIVGPRTECEIFQYISQGFGQSNVYGLDLITYS